MIEKAKEILNSFINKQDDNDCFPINPLEEKTRDEIKFVLKTIVKLEKELKQTKSNFKNSQTHSKNCYKRLKEKYEKLEKAYKNNEVMVRDLNELINKNLDFQKENQGIKDDNTRLWCGLEYANNENAKLKKAISILKEKYDIRLSSDYPEYDYNDKSLTGDLEYILDDEIPLTKKEYELLKEVLE